MLSDMFPRDRWAAPWAYSIGSFIGGGLAFLIGGYVINLLKRVDTVVLPLPLRAAALAGDASWWGCRACWWRC